MIRCTGQPRRRNRQATCVPTTSEMMASSWMPEYARANDGRRAPTLVAMGCRIHDPRKTMSSASPPARVRRRDQDRPERRSRIPWTPSASRDRSRSASCRSPAHCDAQVAAAQVDRRCPGRPVRSKLRRHCEGDHRAGSARRDVAALPRSQVRWIGSVSDFHRHGARRSRNWGTAGCSPPPRTMTCTSSFAVSATTGHRVRVPDRHGGDREHVVLQRGSARRSRGPGRRSSGCRPARGSARPCARAAA